MKIYLHVLVSCSTGVSFVLVSSSTLTRVEHETRLQFEAAVIYRFAWQSVLKLKLPINESLDVGVGEIAIISYSTGLCLCVC